MSHAIPQPAVISEVDCLRLLGSVPVGRVIVSVDALPAAFPVNFRLIGNEIVFRTAPGTKLAAAVSRAVLGFEVDHIEPEHRRGWSVLVVGLSRVVDDPADIDRLEQSGIDSWWASGSAFRYIAIELQRVSGRRVAAPSGAAANAPS